MKFNLMTFTYRSFL